MAWRYLLLSLARLWEFNFGVMVFPLYTYGFKLQGCFAYTQEKSLILKGFFVHEHGREYVISKS